MHLFRTLQCEECETEYIHLSEAKQVSQHMKFLVECYHEQKHMLRTKRELKANDVITLIQSNRELMKLEVRECWLKKKMIFIRKRVLDLLEDEET